MLRRCLGIDLNACYTPIHFHDYKLVCMVKGIQIWSIFWEWIIKIRWCPRNEFIWNSNTGLKFFSFVTCTRIKVRFKVLRRPCRVLSSQFWSSLTRKWYPRRGWGVLNQRPCNQPTHICQDFRTYRFCVHVLYVDVFLFRESQAHSKLKPRSRAASFTSGSLLTLS